MTFLNVELRDGVYSIELNAPHKKNALTVSGLNELARVFERVGDDHSARALMITGAGKAFCAGADVAEWADAEASGALETYGWTEAAHKAFVLLHNLPLPTVAKINGVAVGAGLDLALCCDLRLASHAAKFVPGYTGMGYSPDAGASWSLPKIVGVQRAKAFLFLDQVWSAKEAEAYGLVLSALPPDELNHATEKLVGQLSCAPTLAIKETNKLISQSALSSFEQQLALEHASGLRCGRTNDAAEAILAFKEKRDPIFSGN